VLFAQQWRPRVWSIASRIALAVVAVVRSAAAMEELAVVTVSSISMEITTATVSA
jgi:hypothetical protein